MADILDFCEFLYSLRVGDVAALLLRLSAMAGRMES